MRKPDRPEPRGFGAASLELEELEAIYTIGRERKPDDAE
jgi:hypothetical protein